MLIDEAASPSLLGAAAVEVGGMRGWGRRRRFDIRWMYIASTEQTSKFQHYLLGDCIRTNALTLACFFSLLLLVLPRMHSTWLLS